MVGLTVAQRAGRQLSYPPAGEKGMTVERSSNRLGAAAPLRPARLVIGIIGGMAPDAAACAAWMAAVGPNGVAAAALVAGAAPVQLDGAESAPTEVA